MEGLRPGDRVIGLCGNPNVGKSTLFNRLTGLRQHTGNWPGKTVGSARGRFERGGEGFTLVDIPGCYSLWSRSAEEELARDFVLFGGADAQTVVCDATCLSRGLVLALEVLEVTGRAVLAVNLLDEARTKGITVDTALLSRELGIPVCGLCAGTGEGMDALLAALAEGRRADPAPQSLPPAAEACLAPLAAYLAGQPLPARWLARTLAEGDESLCAALRERLCLDPDRDSALAALLAEARADLRRAGFSPETLGDEAALALTGRAARLAQAAVLSRGGRAAGRDRRIDRVLTHRWLGVPVMVALLGLVLWITVWGANVPSELLSRALFGFGERLRAWFTAWGAPERLVSAAVDGVWRTTAWVVAVMLPPMAIFFPLFTLLEDLGYLPRVAFNLDGAFARCSACGKQGLTMCMGLGCNAAGVTGCRIIDSPRERLIAVLTNSFMPCNGRFPMLIALVTVFFAGEGPGRALRAAGLLTGLLLLGAGATFLASRLLSRTVLRGTTSSFTLELPPYRRPRVGQVLVRSLLDRTLFVLGRALTVAAPAGLVIWLLANLGGESGSLLQRCRVFLEPAGRALGMDGVILLAFLLALPANEIVIPIVLMGYSAGTALMAYGSLSELAAVLTAHGWTAATAACVCLFSLLHWPCGTTLLTIRRETGSWGWTLLAAALPTAFGVCACLLVRALA